MPEKPKIIYTLGVGDKTKANLSTEREERASLVEYDSSKNILNQIEKSRSGLEEAIKAENQSAMSQLGNMVVQTGATAIGDLVQTVGAVFDVPSMIGMAMGSESEDFENAITKIGRGIVESGEENFLIYRKNPEKSFDFGDLGYWTGQLPGVLGSSLGLMAGGIGMFKLGSKGLSLLKLAPKMSKNGALLAEAATEAGIMRHTENFMEAHSVYAQTYDEVSKTIDSLSDEEFAKWKQTLPKDKDIPLDADKETIKRYIAGQAGYRDYRNNTINYAFDFIQMASIVGLKLGKLDTRGSRLGKSRKVFEEDKLSYIDKTKTVDNLKLTKTDVAKNLAFRAGKLLLVQGVTEGAEEFVNAVSELEGLNYGKVLQGKKTEDGYANRFNEYIKNPKVWDAAMWGVIGGTGTGALMNTLSKTLNKKNNSLVEKDEIAEIQTRNFALNDLNAKFAKIKEGISPTLNKRYFGTPEKIELDKEADREAAIREVNIGLATNAVKTGHVSMVLDWLNDDGTANKFVDTGLGTKEEVKKILNSTAEQVKKFEKVYNNTTNSLSWTSIKDDKIRDLIIMRIFNAEANKEHWNAIKENSDKERQRILNDNAYFKSLSTDKQSELKTQVDKLAQLNTITELQESILQMKKEFKDNNALHSLLNEHLETVKRDFNIDDTVNVEQLTNSITKLIREDTTNQLLDYVVETQKSLIYANGSKLKDIEIHAFANDKKVANNVTKNVEDAAKETIKNNKSAKKLELNDKINLNVKNIVNISGEANRKAAETNAIKEFEDLKTVPEYALSGISIDDVIIEFKKRLKSAYAAEKAEEEQAESQVYKEEEILTKEEQKLVDTGFTEEEIATVKLGDLETLNYIIGQLDESIKENIAENLPYALAFKKFTQHYIDKLNNFENEILKEQLELNGNNDDLKYKEAIQGGPNSVHGYLHHAQTVLFKHIEDGVYNIKDVNKQQKRLAFEKTVNELRVGNKVLLRYAKADDFSSYDEYQKYYLKSDGKIVIGLVDNVPVMFLNDSIYLEDEMHLTQSVIDSLNDDSMEDLFNNLRTYYNYKETEENRNEALENITKNKVYGELFASDYLQSEDMKDSEKQIEHLKNILFYGMPYDAIKFDKIKLNNSLTDWYNKIKQDYINRDKIIAELEKNNGTAITEINHVSSGNLITATDSNGKPIAVNLDKTLSEVEGDWENVPLYMQDKNDPFTLTPILKGKGNKTTPLYKEGIGQFKNLLYSSATAGNGTTIPVPLVNTKIETDERAKWVTDKIHEILIELQNGAKLKSKEIKNKIDFLGRVVVVNDKAADSNTFLKFHEAGVNKITGKEFTAHVTFPIPNNKGEYVLYVKQDPDDGKFYQTLYKTLDYETKNHIPVESEKVDSTLNEGIKNLQRSYKIVNLKENKEYVDPVTNTTYKNYKHYLIKSGVVKTYVGKVVGQEVEDKNGNIVRDKISNFSVKPITTLGSSRPLTITIDSTFRPVRRKGFRNADELIDVVDSSGYGFLYKKAVDLGVKIENTFVNDVNFRGRYSPATKTITFSNLINARLDKAAGTAIHELIHGVIDNTNLPKNWKDRIEKYNVELLATIKKIKDGTLIMDENDRKKVLEMLKDDVILQILAKIDKNSTDFRDTEEIITYGLSEKAFADFLVLIPSNVKEKAKNKETFWAKLKNLIIDIVEAITGYNKLDELTDILDEIFTIGTNGNESNTGEETVGETNRNEETGDSTDTESEENPFGIELDDDVVYSDKFDDIDYSLKAVDILQSDKAKQIFDKGNKNNWDLNKILTELQIPKEQKQLILDLNITDREQLALELASNYSYTVKINTAKTPKVGEKFLDREYGYELEVTEETLQNQINDGFVDNNLNTQYYSNLTVPGGINYTENEIATPNITPYIKGHAQFSTDKGIGWFRNDDLAISPMKVQATEEQMKILASKGTRRILEVQSDLFQKSRNASKLVARYDPEHDEESKKWDIAFGNPFQTSDTSDNNDNANKFLQLLNKDNNWVTFFIKSIIQDSAKKGYEKVLFPTGNTASKVEGHTTLEEFKKQKEDRIKELEETKIKNTLRPVPLEINFNEPQQNLSVDEEINQLKQELERVEKEGFGALRPIYNFYENTVTNILNKNYTINKITDEYNNTWNEISLEQVDNKILLDDLKYEKVLYQGYNNLDNRKYNYFTLDNSEASNYGSNVRRIVYNIKNLLQGNSDDYKILVNEDYKLTGTRFDILDNTPDGIKKQNQFFDYLVSKGYKGLDFTMYSDTQYVVLFENVDNFVDNLKYDNVIYDVPLNLQNNKELYKRYNLLNANDKIKLVPNNKSTANWIKTLNQSPNFTFKLRNTIGGNRILIYPKKSPNYEKILNNLKNITDEQVMEKINKCK